MLLSVGGVDLGAQPPDFLLQRPLFNRGGPNGLNRARVEQYKCSHRARLHALREWHPCRSYCARIPSHNLNNPSKLAGDLPGMEADWSPTARMQRALPTVFTYDLPFVRAARAQETDSLHTPTSRVSRSASTRDHRANPFLPYTGRGAKPAGLVGDRTRSFNWRSPAAPVAG